MHLRTKRRLLALAGALLVIGATSVAPVLGAGGAAPSRPTTRLAPPPYSESLPRVRGGAAPGPHVLYEPEPRAPQLENRDPHFHVPFDRVSGTERYADGEYLYTDHLYDDTGSDTDGLGGRPLSANTGNLTYPTNVKRYGDNAADLVEFRVAAGADEIAYRFTLNTLLVPDSTIAVVAFDTDHKASTGSAMLHRDPGAPFPGTDQALTVSGTQAEWDTWNGKSWDTIVLPAHVDLEANQITVIVHRTVADPHTAWKATLAVGLRDPVSHGWLRPGRTATATEPGGASLADASPSGIFNLGFRFDEPALGGDVPPDTAQATALKDHDPTKFAHDIDFGALDRRVAKTNVLTSGTMIRFFPSRLALGEGRTSGFPEYLGQLQPYSLYVPKTYTPSSPAGLTLNLHSLSDFHWQYNGSQGVQQIGEQRRNLVATAMARGEDGWYIGEAEYDVFEMWSDIARQFRLNADHTAITGYSMGGYATYRLGGLYPDLFGRAMSVVGPPADGIWLPPLPPTGGYETLSNAWLENVRNLPYLNIVASEDELVPILGTTMQNVGPAANGQQSFDSLGYRYRFQVYTPAEHLTLAALSYDLPQAIEWLGDGSVDRDPARVTFAYSPTTDVPKLGLVHDHAYWVSDVKLADAAAGEPIPKAVVDVRSEAFGVGDPASTQGADAGVGPLPFTEVNRSWGPAPVTPKANKLDVKLTNVGSVTISELRAGLEGLRDITLDVESTIPSVIHLTDPFPHDVAVAAGRHTYVVPAVVPFVQGAQLSRPAPARRELPATGGRSRLALAVGLVFLGILGRSLASVRSRDAEPG